MDINKINIKNILSWDIETAPLEDFNTGHPMFHTWTHRNRKENLSDEALIELFNTTAGLFAEYSRIVCISCGYLANGEYRVKSFVGTEEEIIDGFLDTVGKFIGSRGGLISLGHNIQNFDMPYLRKAYSRYKPMFTFPQALSDLFEKPWTISDKALDTLQLQKGLNYMFSSMSEVALMLGLPSPKADTDGSMVAELARKGELNRIARYCEGDTYTAFCILMKWMGQEIPPMIAVDVPLPEIPVLQKLVSGIKLTAVEDKKLRTAIKKYKNTPELEVIMNAIQSVNKEWKL